MTYYQDKVVWITGGSSGIGLALAHELAQQGAKLAVSGRNEKALQEFKQQHADKSVLLVPFDVADKAAHKHAIDKIVSEYSTIDIAFLNAGIGSSGARKFAKDGAFSSETVEEVFKVNLFAVAHGVEALLPLFKKTKSGHIVATASLSSFFALPQAAAYAASKAALRSMMRSLAVMYKDVFKVSILYPGFIVTPMTKHIKKMPSKMTAQKAAKIIAKNVAKGKSEISFPWLMTVASKFAGRLPLKWFMKLPSNIS